MKGKREVKFVVEFSYEDVDNLTEWLTLKDVSGKGEVAERLMTVLCNIMDGEDTEL